MRTIVGSLTEASAKAGSIIIDAEIRDIYCSVEIGVTKNCDVLFACYRTGEPGGEIFEVTYTEEALGKTLNLEGLGLVSFRLSGPVYHEQANETITDGKVSVEDMESIVRQRVASVLTAIVDREMGS